MLNAPTDYLVNNSSPVVSSIEPKEIFINIMLWWNRDDIIILLHNVTGPNQSHNSH